MPSVGAKNYITLDRESLKPHEQLEVLRRPGVNGVALRATGFRGRVQRRIALADVVAADAAALQTEIDSHYALGNTQVTVTDNNGVVTNGIWILEVDVTAERIISAVGGLSGGTATHLLTVRFLWVDTNVA